MCCIITLNASPSPSLAEERAPAVPSAGVDPPTPVAGTEHVVRDVVVLVDTHAIRHRNDWDLQQKR